MVYTPLLLEKPLEIRELYSIHYFEYTSSYAFSGESHDFWELLYVDKGAIHVTAGDQTRDLTRGQLIFHAPGEFHALSANGEVAPNLVVIGFRCDSPAMNFFLRRITFAGAAERALMARIVEESAAVFSTPLDDPATSALQRRDNVPFGSEQLLAAALEELLIRLIRQGGSLPFRPIQPHRVDERLAHITEYLEQRLDQPLTIDQICRDNLVGRSQLQKYFHAQTGGGVMDYFSHMKIKAARQMIREGRLNFTQIAARLGFQSVHYFSRRFKRFTGMSPSEYASSVKMLAESPLPVSDDRTNNV